MEPKIEHRVSYQLLCSLAIGVGVVGLALQLLPGWELLAFMLNLAVLGGLVGGRNSYEEKDRQQLDGSYKPAYDWLLLILLAAYAFNTFSGWLPIEGAVDLINGRWPGLMIALLCVLLGLAGFQPRSGEGRPPV